MTQRIFSDIEANELRDIGLLEDVLGKQLARLRARRNRMLNTSIKPSERPVADHGLMRYLERVEHLNVEAAKARLREWFTHCEPTGVRGVYQHPTTGEQVVTNRSGVIVTVLPAGHRMGYESSDFENEDT